MHGRRRRLTRAEQRERLDALGVTIAKKRDEAVQARKESGIEAVWITCEEAYLGIDDANRHEFADAKWAKATNTEGPISTDDVKNDDARSNAFVRLTSRYVDFASAKLAEIALPIDDKAFSFDATPVPDLVQGMQQEMEQVMPGMEQPPQQVDESKAVVEQAGEAAKKAEERIYDWMVECRHQAEMKKTIHDAARIGVGVLKGPIPHRRKEMALVRDGDQVALKAKYKTVPVSKWVDPWNCFPAPGCGENIQDGDYFMERDYLSPKKLRELKNGRAWNSAQIDKVLKEGPGKVYADGSPRDEEKIAKHRFERWQFYGLLTREELEIAGVRKIPEDCEEAYAIVTLINDTVVRCVLNPLDSGRFPYHAFPWSRRADHWAGVGVAEQVDMPQRMVNASTRALLENAGISAGVQIILDKGLVEPADGSWTITRNKVWFKTADAILDDVRKAFHIFDIPNVQNDLMAIIEYGMRLAEEHTSIPLVSMGQYAQSSSPQTFGQADLQNSNAHTLLRDLGETLDDFITEPVVEMYYEWLLLDPDVPTEEKGDFKINAHGTSAMVERAIQEMTIVQALQLAENPIYGANPKKTYAMWLKTKRINPEDIQYSDEEIEQLQENQPGDPRIQAAEIAAQSRIEAAQINAQAGIQKEGIKSKTAVQKMVMDTDRDTAYVQEQRMRSREQAQQRMIELQQKRELALLDYANKKDMTLAQIQAELAQTTAKLRTQKQLAAASGKAPQVATPPTEPPGRAPDGQAYQR